MKTIIHDLNKDVFINNDNNYIINSNLCQNTCIGCFSCWIKHPKKCIYRDNFSNLAGHLKNADELVIISKARYGSYSTNVKRVLERCLGYILPYFEIRNKMIHHVSRYPKKLNFKVIFYGDITKEEKKCLEDLVRANSINLNAKNYEINYYQNEEEIIDAYLN